MRKLLFLLLLFGVNLSCQTGRKAAKKQVTIDLPDNKKHRFWEYETEKPMKFKALALGYHHNCGILEDGSATCWGDNRYGQRDAPAGKFKVLALGGVHSCGIREDGSATCWGLNRDGQANAPAGKFKALALGGYHSCGIREDGSATCWGDNDDGQRDAPAGKFKALALGVYHSCGIRENGSATCWGNNDSGQRNAPGAIKGRAARICMGSSKNTCDFTDGCIWDPEPSAANAGHCISKNWIACFWVKSAEACMQVGCNWAGTTCTPKPRSECYLQREKAQCMKLPGCQFDGKRCMDKAREL